VLVRSWNLFHGNSVPPQRRGFLPEMVALATADQPDVLCVQEVPGWALRLFTVGDLASRAPLGVAVGRAVTALHHGLIRGAVSGQGLGIWLGPGWELLDHHVLRLNPSELRRRQAQAWGLGRHARWTWAKERRIVQVVRARAGSRRCLVANVHCTPYFRGTRIPACELLRAAEYVISLAAPEEAVVLAGDFNVGPVRSDVFDRLAEPARGFSGAGRGIDQVLVRGAAVSGRSVWPEERRRRSDGTVLSDHAPVDVEIPSPPAARADRGGDEFRRNRRSDSP
jgi:endonuclease/exonuclease/phosphatase family metal-dependent hydrolase